MIYRIAADLVLVLHANFIVFVVAGTALVVLRPWLVWLHLPAVLWVALLEFNGWYCPLTPLEVALRERAGDAGYTGGFIEHYVMAAMYPEGLTRDMQLVLGVVVVAINVAGYALVWWRRKSVRALTRRRA